MSQLDQGLVGTTRPKFNENKNAKLIYTTVLVGFLLVTGFLIYQIKNFKTSYSISQFIPENDDLLIKDHKLNEMFKISERNSFFLLIKNSKYWLNSEGIKTLSDIEIFLLKNSDIKKIFGIHNVQSAVANKDQLLIGSAFQSLPEKDWSGFVQGSSFLIPNFINKELDQVVLEIEVNEDAFNTQNSFLDLKSELKKEFPNLNFFVAGGLPTQAELSTYLSSEIKLFFLLIMAMFVVISYLFFSDVKTVLSIFLSLLIGNLSMVGGLSWLGIKFNALLSTVPVMVSISIILVLIHTLHLWAGERGSKSKRFVDRVTDSNTVLRKIFSANLLGTVTMSLGFWTLSFNSLPIIKQYGWVIAILMMMSWVYAMIWLYLVMPILETQLRDWTAKKAYWMMSIFQNQNWILKTMSLILPVFVLSGYFLNFSTRLFDDLPTRSETREANSQVDQNFSGMIGVNFIITGQNESDWKSGDKFKDLLYIDSEIKKDPAVRTNIGITHILRTDQRAPASDSASIAETMFLYSMAEENPLDQYLSKDGKSIRLIVRFQDIPSYQIQDKISGFKSLIKNQFPGFEVETTGLGATVLHRNIQISKELVFRFWHSMVIIAVLLMFVFRSIRWVLVACIPNLVPPAFLIGAMGLLQIPVKPSVAVIFSIALGLAFNNTVYVLLKLKKLYQSNSDYLPVKRSFLEEGNPCLFATLVVFAGFSVFLFSEFQVNRIFGLLMLLSILAGLIGDLVLLPILLKRYPSLLISRSTRTIGSVLGYAIILLMVVLVIPNSSIADDQKAEKILKNSQRLLQVKDESADVKMIIIEADGSQKVRDIEIESLKSKDSYYVMAKVKNPADIKGTGFLGIIKGESENQWIYLPSSKQVRRVVGAASSAGLLGSEISAADLNSTAVKDAKVKLIQEGSSEVILEITPKQGTSRYNKVMMYLDGKYLPQKLDYFEASENVKSVQFESYKKFKSVFRPTKMVVKNHVNKRGTEITADNVKVNQGLKPTDFNPDRLAD